VPVALVAFGSPDHVAAATAPNAAVPATPTIAAPVVIEWSRAIAAVRRRTC
jgi:hypothetical protein